MSAQFEHVRTAALTLTAGQLALPTRLGTWTVRELLAHIALGMRSVTRAVTAPEPTRRDLALADWPAATGGFADRVDEGTRAFTETSVRDGEDLARLYADTAAEFAETLAGTADERLVATRLGGMTLADFLVTRALELTVHTDDLNAATGLAVPHDRQALATCTRFLADALALKAPGGSVEVRVPPYAVVQCVEGPRHTRGTPPNVVETDPLTWTRLATGRTTWTTARESARLRASGDRADLSPWLPLMT
ncbi:maleylpyruvate isomerase family mycothiol-dependent enzyme [Streptomyces coeruleoprunus]